MGASRIEQLIEDIYEFVESCRMQPLSSSKVIVPKDELYDLLDELRLRTPDEIKRYQKIISNRDAIIADAEEKAQTIMAQATENATSLVDENEIMQQAYYHANELVNQASEEAQRIIAQANMDADQIRRGAFEYTNDLLAGVQSILTNAYETSRNNFEGVLNSLKTNIDIVEQNRNELSPQQQTSEEAAPTVQEEMASEQPINEDEYQFDEDTFINNIEN